MSVTKQTDLAMVKADLNKMISTDVLFALHQGFVATKFGQFEAISENDGDKIVRERNELYINSAGSVLSLLVEGVNSESLSTKEDTFSVIIDELAANKTYTSRTSNLYKSAQRSFARKVMDDASNLSISVSIDLENRVTSKVVSESQNTLTASGVGEVIDDTDLQRLYTFFKTQNAKAFLPAELASSNTSTEALFPSYVCICSQDIIPDIAATSNFVFATDYGSNGSVSSAEYGASKPNMLRFFTSTSPALAADENGYYPILCFADEAFTIYGKDFSKNAMMFDEYEPGLTANASLETVPVSVSNLDRAIDWVLRVKLYFATTIDRQDAIVVLYAKKS